MKCEACGFDAMAGESFCSRCGANLDSVRQVSTNDMNWPDFSVLMAPLGWKDLHEGAEDHLVITSDFIFTWFLWLSAKRDCLYGRTAWNINDGIPEGQLLNAVNAMNASGWSGANYVESDDDDSRSLVTFFSVPLSGKISAAEVDFRIRRVNHEVEILMSRSGMIDFLT